MKYQVFATVLVASFFLTACGGGSSSSGGGGGDVQLTDTQPVDGNTVVRLRLGNSCGGTYDVYHNGRLVKAGLRDSGHVDVTVHPGNHQFTLMVAGTQSIVDDDVLTGVSGRVTHTFQC